MAPIEMAEIPSGTVTFLFTDIEGSTGLLKKLRDRYPEVLAQHRDLLRGTFAAHGGVEVDSQGDAFFVVFPRAAHAGLAAVAAQRALSAHPWPDGTEVRVRMALHTGEAEISDGRYHGLGVHRAARILSGGHGGQILLSQTTSSVLEDEGLPGATVRSLGRFRLKDLDRPEQLYQLDAYGLRSSFPPLRAERSRRIGRRRLVLAAVPTAAGAAAAVALVLVLGGGGDSAPALTGNSVAILDATNAAVRAVVEVGADPARVAVGSDGVWVTNETAGTVSRIDPEHNVVVDTTRVGSAPTGIAVGRNAVWVANGGAGTVSRIHPATNEVVQTVPVGSGPRDVAAGLGAIWVANGLSRTVTRLDPRDGDVEATIPLEAAPTAIAAGAGAIWVTQENSALARIDADTNSVLLTLNVGNGPSAVAAGAAGVWVANTLDGTVSHVDPAADAVSATIPVGGAPHGLAPTGSGVWVVSQSPGVASFVDSASRSVTRTVDLGLRPVALASGDGTVWAALRTEAGELRAGGTLHVIAPEDFDTIDPAFAYTGPSWQALSVLGDGLTAFRRVGGVAGTELVADLAVALPKPTDGGRTYAFRLRPGVRYSNGSDVQAAHVRTTIERIFKAGSPAGPAWFGAIAGAAVCERTPEKCDLSRGIETDDRTRTVTFRLTRPDPELLYKLALPAGYLIPADSPDEQTEPLAGTGPYRVAEYVQGRTLRLERNPHYREWSKAAQPKALPDAIEWRLDVPAEEHAAEIIAGRADHVAGGALGIASDELVAQNPKQIVQAGPVGGTVFVALNTRVPPFDSLDARRAVNYAIDRAAMVELAGGPTRAQPTCQILPPGFPGYVPYCPYTTNPTRGGLWTEPDLARAEALVARSGTRGLSVTVWAMTKSPEAPVVARTLERIGFRARVKILDRDAFIPIFFDPASKAQAAVFGWFADWPSASTFFPPVFSCGGESNSTGFCRPDIDRLMRRALRLQATELQEANRLWAEVDRRVVDGAAWAPLFTPFGFDFVSKRVENYQAHPIFGMLLSQVSLR